MNKIILFILLISFQLNFQAQVPTTFTWNSYTCGSNTTSHTYTYTQTVNGVRMDATIIYSGTAANIGWTNGIATGCSPSTYTSPAYNASHLGVTTGGLILSTDRASSGPTAPTPTISLVFTPAICGSVTFSIGDVNGANNTFRDSIRVNAWDGNNTAINMTTAMVTRNGGATYPYPPFVSASTSLIVYGNSDYTGTCDVFNITATKVSKVNIVYYSGKKDYNNATITNPSEQRIVISRIRGNAPPTVASSFACNTNSTSVNLIATATNTSATNSYTWTTTTGTINSGSNALTANVKSPGTYTLTAYNGPVASGCLTQTVISLSSVNCSLLPIELTDFYATIKDKNVEINWETISELNSDYFIIERSSDGINFEPLSQMQSSKNSSQIKQYNYIDENPLPNINYYRLKLIEKDGSYRFSRIIDAILETEKIVINHIKPNPTKDMIHFEIHSSKKTDILIELTDFTGLKVYKELKNIEAGQSTENLNLQNLAQGVYILKISSANNELISYTKIIKN